MLKTKPNYDSKHETVFCQTPRENRVHCPLQKSPGTMDQVGPLKQPSPACVSSVLFARFTHSLLIVSVSHLQIAKPNAPSNLYIKNIARGTTDPEIDSVTWIKFSNKMSPLAFVANLATRWRHLQ